METDWIDMLEQWGRGMKIGIWETPKPTIFFHFNLANWDHSLPVVDTLTNTQICTNLELRSPLTVFRLPLVAAPLLQFELSPHCRKLSLPRFLKSKLHWPNSRRSMAMLCKSLLPCLMCSVPATCTVIVGLCTNCGVLQMKCLFQPIFVATSWNHNIK
jgi:hypothetical protein